MKDKAHNENYPTGVIKIDVGYPVGYDAGYTNSTFSRVIGVLSSGSDEDDGEFYQGSVRGKRDGAEDKRLGKMNMFHPQIKKNDPKIKTPTGKLVNPRKGTEY